MIYIDIIYTPDPAYIYIYIYIYECAHASGRVKRNERIIYNHHHGLYLLFISLSTRTSGLFESPSNSFHGITNSSCTLAISLVSSVSTILFFPRCLLVSLSLHCESKLC